MQRAPRFIRRVATRRIVIIAAALGVAALLGSTAAPPGREGTPPSPHRQQAVAPLKAPRLSETVAAPILFQQPRLPSPAGDGVTEPSVAFVAKAHARGMVALDPVALLAAADTLPAAAAHAISDSYGPGAASSNATARSVLEVLARGCESLPCDAAQVLLGRLLRMAGGRGEHRLGAAAVVASPKDAWLAVPPDVPPSLVCPEGHSGGPTVHALLGASAKVAVEWAAAQLAMGASGVLISARPDQRRVVSLLARSLRLAGGADLFIGPCTRVVVLRGEASDRCARWAAGSDGPAACFGPRGSRRAVYLPTTDAIPHPFGSPMASWWGPTAAGVVLPVAAVGHSGAWRDEARSLLERTNHAAGAWVPATAANATLPSLWGPQEALPSDGSLRLPLHDITARFNASRSPSTPGGRAALFPSAAPPLGTLVWDPAAGAARVLQGPGAALTSRLVIYGCPSAATAVGEGPHRAAALRAAVDSYVRRGFLAGFERLPPGSTRRCIARLDAAVRAATGRSAAAPRMALLADASADATAAALRLLRKRRIVRPRGDGAALTAASLLNGSWSVVSEPFPRPVTPAMVRAPTAGPCRRWHKDTTPGAVALCGVVRNRAKLTVEWVQWHRALGVARVHLYDDGSTDGLAQVLAPMIQTGAVTLRSVPTAPFFFGAQAVPGPQLACYADCLAREGSTFLAAMNGSQEVGAEVPEGRGAGAEWVGLLDTDEFWVPPDGRCLPDTLRAAAAPAVGAVGFPWRTVVPFRSDRDTAWRTPMEAAWFDKGRATVPAFAKVFVRPAAVAAMPTVHYAALAPPYRAVWFDGRPLPAPGWDYGSAPPWPKTAPVVQHYTMRSLASHVRRFTDGRVADQSYRRVADIAAAVAEYDSGTRTVPEVGYTPQPPAPLRKLHAVLLKALGF